MAEKIKYTQKELKKPDKFRTFVADSVDYASENFNKILIAIALLIVVFIAAFVVTSRVEQKGIEANTKFEEAMDNYERGNSEQALNGFLATKNQFPDEKISQIALYYAGIINYEKGNYGEAITLFDRFIKDDPEDQMLVDAAHLTQGLASFNQGKWQQAVDYLSKLAKTGSPYEFQAKLHLGLSYEKLGKQEQAQEIYRDVLIQRTGNSGFPIEQAPQEVGDQ